MTSHTDTPCCEKCKGFKSNGYAEIPNACCMKSDCPCHTQKKSIREDGVGLSSVDRSIYNRVHYWLKQNYGKADHCEATDCEGRSEAFAWALRRGCNYEFDRGSFLQLCYPCHFKYDLTDSRREAIRASSPNLKKDKCPKGHPYSGENLRVTVEGHRQCIKCVNQRAKNQRERAKIIRSAKGK